MYCVYQICAELKEKIIGYVDSPDDFFPVIENHIKNIYGSDYKVLETETVSSIQANDNVIEGCYLLNNNDSIQFLRKTKEISMGYIYNSVIYSTKLLFTWKLLPLDDTLSKINNTNKNSDSQQMATSKFQILKFNFDKITINDSFLIIGGKGNGKKQIVKNIISTLNKTDDFIENSLIISSTEKVDPFYSLCYPGAKIIYELDNIIVQEYLNKEKGCIILDDCFTSKNILNFTCNSNYYKVPFIITLETPMLIKPIERKLKFDYIFLFENDFMFDKYKLYEFYGSIFPTFPIFKLVHTELSKDNSVMIIAQNVQSDKISDKVFWFKLTDKISQ